MNPSLKEQLKKWKQKHQEFTPKNNKNKKKKDLRKTQKHRGEHLKERELKELMGIYQPIYKRGKGGAFRQR